MPTTSRSKVGIESRRHVPRVGRFYDLDPETSYPSVTTILSALAKGALVNWAANTERAFVIDVAAKLYTDLANTPPMSRDAYVRSLTQRLGLEKAHEKELAKGQEVGSQAHHYIEWLTRKRMGQVVGRAPEITPDAERAVAAWVEWTQSVACEPLLVEEVVWSRTHEYAGTIDLVANINGVLTLVDYKTGKKVYREAFLQSAAYQVALEELGHGRVEQAYIVRLPKLVTDAPFEVVQVPERDALFATFLALKAVWAWANEGGAVS